MPCEGVNFLYRDPRDVPDIVKLILLFLKHLDFFGFYIKGYSGVKTRNVKLQGVYTRQQYNTNPKP